VIKCSEPDGSKDYFLKAANIHPTEKFPAEVFATSQYHRVTGLKAG